MKRKYKVGLGLALVSVFAVVATACGRGHFRSSGELSDAEVKERIERGVDHVLGKVDASDEQVARVTDIFAAALPDVRALREERKALAEELKVALRKQQVNREEIEALRAKALNLVDRASAKGAQALTDAANELNPTQRAELVAEWNRRMGG